MGPSEIVAELWRRIQARDWDAVGELLAEDFVLEWPNARIRIRGRTNFVGFNRSYPKGWSIEVLRIVAAGNIVVSEVRVPHPTVGPYLRTLVSRSRGRPTGARARVLGLGALRGAGPGTAPAGSSRCDESVAEAYALTGSAALA